MEDRLPLKIAKKENSYIRKVKRKIITLVATDNVSILQWSSSNIRSRAVDYQTIPEYSATLRKKF